MSDATRPGCLDKLKRIAHLESAIRGAFAELDHEQTDEDKVRGAIAELGYAQVRDR